MADRERTPGVIAGEAAELIRELNHATFGGSGYRWPADVDRVIAELEILTSRLPQALEQASTWLEREDDAGRVRDDGRYFGVTNPQPGRAASSVICEAIPHATSLHSVLSVAHQLTARLAGIDEDSGDA